MNKPVTIDHIATERPRFTAQEFVRMVEVGAFPDMRVELVEGELVKMMMSSGFSHGEVTLRLAAMLLDGYAGSARLGFDVMVQTGADTIRGPDIIAVSGNPPGQGAVPAEAVLLAVEIAKTTLNDDLGGKRADYARAGIPHYWVVDVDGRKVHVMGDPAGDAYRQVAEVAFGAPLAVPGTDAAVTLD